MKITDVLCHILQCKVDKPFVSARGWVYGTRSTCLVEISTDEGVAIEATVSAIHEQVGGSDKPPGMRVIPALAHDAAKSWWSARIALPEEPAPVPVPAPEASPGRARSITIQPRPKDGAAPVAVVAVEQSVPEPIQDDNNKKTVVMDSIDPALLDQLITDNGHTTTMDAVDLKALGLDPTARASQEMAAIVAPLDVDDDGEDKSRASSPDLGASKSGAVQRRKRNPKKR